MTSIAVAMPPAHCYITPDFDGLNFEELAWSDDCVDSLNDSLLSSENFDFDGLPIELFSENGNGAISVDQEKEDFNQVLEQWTRHLSISNSTVANELDFEEVVAAVLSPASVDDERAAVVSAAEFGVVVNEGRQVSPDSESSALEALDLESLLEQFEAKEASSRTVTIPQSHVCNTSRLTAKPAAASTYYKRRSSRLGNRGCRNLPPMKMPRFSIILKRDPPPAQAVTPPPALATPPPALATPPPALATAQPPLPRDLTPVPSPPLALPPPLPVPVEVPSNALVSSASPVRITLPASLPSQTPSSPVVTRPPPTGSDLTGPSDHDYCYRMTAEVQVAVPLLGPSLPIPSSPGATTVPQATPPSPLKMKSVLKPIEKREAVAPDPESFYSKLPDYYTSIVPMRSVLDLPCSKTRKVTAVVPQSRYPPSVMTAIPQCPNLQTAKVVIPQRRSVAAGSSQRFRVVGTSVTSKENSAAIATSFSFPTHNRLPPYLTGLATPKIEKDIATKTQLSAAASLPSSVLQARTAVPKVIVKLETREPLTMPNRVAGAVAAAMQRLPTKVIAVPSPVLAPRVTTKPPAAVVKTKQQFYEEEKRQSRHQAGVRANRLDGHDGILHDHHDGRSTRWQHGLRISGRVKPSSRSPSYSNSSRSHSGGSSRSRSRSSSSSSSSSSNSRSSSSRSRTSRRRRHHHHLNRRSVRSRSRSSRNGRDSSSSSRRRELKRQQEDEKHKQIEDRRVVHVGNIHPETTRSDLRRRFGVFGHIENIALHHRKRGDAFGFITYSSKVGAFSALEHGNDDSSLPQYELSLGGRRLFCLNRYSDLDSLANNYEAKPPPILKKKCDVLDFDSLLQAAKRNSRQSGKI